MSIHGTGPTRSLLRSACFACGLGIGVLIASDGRAQVQPIEPPSAGTAEAARPAEPARVPEAGAAGRIYAPARSPIGLRLPAAGGLREWTIAPSIGAEVTVTNNAALAPPAEAKSDVLLDVYPGVAISGRSPRVELDLDYTGQAAYAARGTLSSAYFNSLGAATRVTAIENFLFVDASAVVSQQYTSAFAPRPVNPEGEPANSAENRSVAVSPYIQGLLRGPDIAYTLRYNWTASVLKDQTDVTDFPDSRTTEWVGQLAGPIGRKFAWSLDYLNSVINWENLPFDQKYQQYLGTVYYQVDPLVTVSVSAGREYNNFDLVDEWYTNYGGGIRWRPFQRTLVAANVIKRFFGTGYEVVFSNRHRRTAWNLSADRSIATYNDTAFSTPGGGTRSLLDAALTAQITDPIERRAAVNRLVALSGLPPLQANTSSFFTQAVMLQNQAEASFAIIGARNIATITAYRRDQRPIGLLTVGTPDDEFANIDKQTETGAAVSGTHRLTPQTAITAIYTRSYVRGHVGDLLLTTSTEDAVLLTLSTRLGRKTTAFVGARYQRFVTDPSDEPPVSERAIMAGLTYFF